MNVSVPSRAIGTDDESAATFDGHVFYAPNKKKTGRGDGSVTDEVS